MVYVQKIYPTSPSGLYGELSPKIGQVFGPYIEIKFYQHSNGLKYSEAYTVIELYLSSNSTEEAKRLKANFVNKGKVLILSIDAHEQVFDEF